VFKALLYRLTNYLCAYTAAGWGFMDNKQPACFPDGLQDGFNIQGHQSSGVNYFNTNFAIKSFSRFQRFMDGVRNCYDGDVGSLPLDVGFAKRDKPFAFRNRLPDRMQQSVLDVYDRSIVSDA
jgi:hypothetical protein